MYWSLTTLMKTPWVGPDTVGEKMFASLAVVMGAILFAALHLARTPSGDLLSAHTATLESSVAGQTLPHTRPGRGGVVGRRWDDGVKV